MTTDKTERPPCPCCGKEARRHIVYIDNPWREDADQCSDETLRFDSTSYGTWDYQGEGHVTKRDKGPGGIKYVVVWDGTYRHGYGAFCSLRCASEFGNAAYASGFRVPQGGA